MLLSGMTSGDADRAENIFESEREATLASFEHRLLQTIKSDLQMFHIGDRTLSSEFVTTPVLLTDDYVRGTVLAIATSIPKSFSVVYGSYLFINSKKDR